MAGISPPDGKGRAGTKRGGKSGKVADFRYRPPSRSNDSQRADAGVVQQRSCSGDFRAARDGPATTREAAWSDRQAYAALDLGTNNCRLLIARPKIRRAHV